MRPRISFGIAWDDEERERLEDSLRDWWTEDDQMDRERDLKEGQDIRDEYDDEVDDLKILGW